MKVMAAVARHFGEPLRIEPLEVDEPRESELLVRLIASGVARVDREAIAGRLAVELPFVPGSEAAGIVERVGPGVQTPAPGAAVLIAYGACGLCPNCRDGDRRRCQEFETRNLAGCRADGTTPFVGTTPPAGEDPAVRGFFFGQSSFATHVLCRAADAVVVDTGVPLELFAALTGEFLTGAAPLLDLDLRAENTVLIAGAGFVGLAACMVAKARGIKTIIVADPDEDRRKLALAVGATIAVPMDDGLPAVVASLAPDGARFALDASGAASGRTACLASLARNGTCASTETQPIDESVGAAGTCVSADAGIDAGKLLPRLIAFYRDGELPIERLVNFFPFEQVNDALGAAETKTVVKAVLRFSLGSFGDLDRAGTEGSAVDMENGGSSTEPAGDTTEEVPAAPPVTA